MLRTTAAAALGLAAAKQLKLLVEKGSGYFDANGWQRQHKIKGHSDISFDQARKAAKRLRSEVVLGGDPAATKEDKKAIPTYAGLSVQHLAHP